MGDQYEPIAFGGDPPPPPAPDTDPFAENQYEIPTFGNKKVPPPPPSAPAREKSIASDSLASHKGRLSYQDKGGSAVKHKNKNQKLNPEAVKNFKKNKTKGSMQQDSNLKSANDPNAVDAFDDKKGKKTKSGEKKSGTKSGVVSITNKPSAEVQSSVNDLPKPKRKKTAQEIIAERQRYKGSVKKDLVISSIIITIALVAIIATIIGIGAATDFKYDEI